MYKHIILLCIALTISVITLAPTQEEEIEQTEDEAPTETLTPTENTMPPVTLPATEIITPPAITEKTMESTAPPVAEVVTPPITPVVVNPTPPPTTTEPKVIPSKPLRKGDTYMRRGHKEEVTHGVNPYKTIITSPRTDTPPPASTTTPPQTPPPTNATTEKTTDSQQTKLTPVKTPHTQDDPALLKNQEKK